MNRYLILPLCGLLLNHAAVPPAEAQADADEMDVYELSAFEVRVGRDYGYRATHSMTATRIGVPLSETPLSIQVVTGDFVDDLGLESFSDALRYISSTTGDTLTAPGDSGNTTVRGFPTAWTLRNGYRRFTNIPMENVDRVEVVKGPVSVFFGQAAPGGITNIISKKPDFYDHGSISATYGSYDRKRGRFELNRELVEGKLAARIFFSAEDSKDWRDFEYTKGFYVSPSVLYRPFRDTTILIEYEHSKRRFNNANANIFYNPVALQWYEDPPPEILARYNNNLELLQRTWRQVNIERWRQDYRSTFGETIPIDTEYMPELHPSGWAFNGNGFGATQRYKTHDFNLDVRQRVQDWLELRLGGNWNESGNSAKNFPSADRPYPDGSLDLIRSLGGRGWNQTTTFQTDALFKFRLAGVFQRVLVGYERVDDKRFDWPMRVSFDNIEGLPDPYGVARSGRQMYSRHYPFFDPQPSPRDIFDGWGSPSVEQTNARNGYYLSHQAELWNGRVNTMAGIRHEDYRQFDFGSVTQEVNGTTYMGGFTAQVIEGLNFFASYSENFMPNRGANITGPGVRDEDRSTLPPETGSGFDIGFKSELFDERLTGMVTFFNLERQNIRAQDAERTANDPRNLDDNPNNNVTWYTTSGLQRTQGTEWELIYTPTRNYQLLFSYSWMWKANLIRNDDLPPDSFQFVRRLRNAPRHKLAVWNKYTFIEGPLTGVELGVGVRHSSRHHPRDGASPMVNPSYTVFDGLIAYSREIGGRDWRFSLNLENLTDKLYLEGHTAAGDPFKANFTATLRF
ncbi:MAG: TonB-dependent receptor plug domain-containing protein [Opitutales bacterium]|nr:TonB-dependent receptor plug domain-containing protein [Opitutales bacterium]